MSLFKPMSGDSSRLSQQEFHEGYAWLTTNDGKFYIDAMDGDQQKRILINPDSVEYSNEQTLTDAQKAQARENIGASSVSDVQTHIENTDIHVTAEEKDAWNAKLDSYTETDPTVPAWAKESSKPSYTADEVGAVSYDAIQNLTDEQKAQARDNIELSDSTLLTNVIVTLPFSVTWSSVTYGDDKFVSVAFNSANATYSTDGITWTETTLCAPDRWYSVIYGNGRFVAVGYTYFSSTEYYPTINYSDDGINWNEVSLSFELAKLYSATYGNNRFVAISYNSNIAIYSDDGVTWTKTTLPASAKWYSVTYGNGRFVAVAYNSNIAAYSDDGINWIQTTLPSSAYWYSVTYGNGRFVAVAQNSNIAAYSDDGINWCNATDRLQNTSGEDVALEIKNALNITPSDIGAQTVLTGTDGQIVGFDEDGNAVARDIPTTAEIGAVSTSGGTMTGDLILNEKALKIKIPDSLSTIIHEATLSGSTSYQKASPTGGGPSLEMTNDPSLLFDKPVGFQSGLSVYGNRIYAVSDPQKNSDAANKWYVDSKVPKSVSISLTSSGWDSATKTQTVAVSGILADESAQLITPIPASAFQSAYYEAGIACTGQASDSLTFTATKVPTSDLTVYVMIQEMTAV